ncbi:MAG: regulatory protein RecX [Lawsonibacter sp.]|nr:regulatory protein RecX [Lawsonibacter sp.]
MVVQELKPSKRMEGRWLAVMEDGSILRLGEGEVIEFALYTGKELSPEEANSLLASAKRSSWKEKALDLLARKPQSRMELERKLREWGARSEDGTAICDRMEELGYLDDPAYAARVVRHYSAKGFGEKKLRDELYHRGLPRELWDEALSQAQDPAETIDLLIAKKLDKKSLDRKELQKVSAALARRGYSWSDISDALRRYGAETGENE